MQAAAQRKADDQQSQTAHEQVEETDGKAVGFFRHRFVPRAGEGEDDRRQQHTEDAPRTAATVVADGGHQNAAEADHTAQRLGGGHPVGVAVEEMGEDHAQKTLGAVQDAAKGTCQQGDGRIVKGVLRRGLPQTQCTGFQRDFAAWKVRELALQQAAAQQNEEAAQHEADACKAEDGGGVGGVDREQPVAHFDEGEGRSPQAVAEDRQQYGQSRGAENAIQFFGTIQCRILHHTQWIRAPTGVSSP